MVTEHPGRSAQLNYPVLLSLIEESSMLESLANELSTLRPARARDGYPIWLRDKVCRVATDLIDRDHTLGAVATAIGLPHGTLKRWLDAKTDETIGFRPVRLSTAVSDPPTAAMSLRIPGGYIVDGLGVDDLIALLPSLSWLAAPAQCAFGREPHPPISATDSTVYMAWSSANSAKIRCPAMRFSSSTDDENLPKSFCLTAQASASTPNVRPAIASLVSGGSPSTAPSRSP